MDISKSLWIFLDVLERYEHLLERESLEASKEPTPSLAKP